MRVDIGAHKPVPPTYLQVEDQDVSDARHACVQALDVA